MIDRRTMPASILVVEDDLTIRDLLVRLLITRGYHVDVAGDGLEARGSVQRRQPDLILLDIGLPGESGLTLCRFFKQQPGMRLTPIVLLTGLNDRNAKLEGITAGADDFLAKPFDATELTARVASLVRIKRYTDELESAESIIKSLALTIEARDAYTDGHCQRLADYGTALGQEIGLAADQIEALNRGGYLHDVGKIGIPDSILLKPGRLTPAEYETMKAHAVIGERLCGELHSLAAVRPIVRHHHERRDGTGYPDGLHGDEIPLLAQIIAIVDEFDAITTTRPYRAALSQNFAFDELTREAAAGIHSAELVVAFMTVATRAGFGASAAIESAAV